MRRVLLALSGLALTTLAACGSDADTPLAEATGETAQSGMANGTEVDPGNATDADQVVLPDESGDDEPLRLRIDMQEGRFEVRSGPAGSELRVDGTFASTYYELTDERDEDADGGRGLTIRFRSSRSLPVRLFAGLMAGRGNPNRLTVSIPEDLLVDLSFEVPGVDPFHDRSEP